jgi:Meckel syndrome type 1 protein
VPNAAQVPSNPEGDAPAAAAIPVQPTLAAATVAPSVAQAVPQPAAQAAAQPAFQSASPQAPHYAAPLQSQLAKPLFTLVGAPQGQHIMTLKVSPEDLGPLTVRAQIDAAGVRIELFAPGDAGREAVRGILPELRRELHGAGFGASLDLSDHNSPGFGQHGAQHGTGQDRTGTGGQFATGRDPGGTGSGPGGSGSGPGDRNGPRPGNRWDALADDQAIRTARLLNGPQTTLDILV